jgi:hypothetical protein
MNRSLLVFLLVVVAASLGTATSASARPGRKSSTHRATFIKCGTFSKNWFKKHRPHLAPHLHP